METVKKPQFKIGYNSRDITKDISPYLVSASYSGEVGKKADTLQIVVDDTAGQWRNNWYPIKGDKLSLEIGYQDFLVSCGNFVIDEIEMSGPPNQLSIRAIAAGYAKQIRTKSSFAHEKKTLAQIADVVAQKNGFSVSGTIPGVFIKRATQYRETDLHFLERLAGNYGCVFSVRENVLVFTDADSLEAGEKATDIDQTDLVSYTLQDKTAESYSAVSVSYHDPKTKKTITATESADGTEIPVVPLDAWVDPLLAASYLPADTMVVNGKRVENKGQASAKAKSILRHNLNRLSGTITIEGNPLYMEGGNFDLTGMGAMSGRFHITQVEHRIDAGGYFTTLNIKRTAAIDKSRWAPKTVINQDFKTTKI